MKSAFFIYQIGLMIRKYECMFSNIVGLSMWFSKIRWCIDITVKRLPVTNWIQQCNRMHLLHFTVRFIVIDST